MKILHVMLEVASGLSVYVRTLAQALTDADNPNHILSIRLEAHGLAAGQPGLHAVASDGIPHHRLSGIAADATDPRFLCSEPRTEALFADFLEQLRPEVVHFHSLSGMPASLLQIAHVLGYRTVLTLHDVCALCRPYRFFIRDDGRECAGPLNGHACIDCNPELDPAWLLERFRYAREVAGQCCDAVVAVSDYIRDAHAVYGYGEGIRVIRHGVGLAGLDRPRRIERPPRLLFVGGLQAQKGLHVLLEALRGIPPDLYRLDVYGGGSHHQFEAMIRPRFPDLPMRYRDRYPAEAVAEVMDGHDLLIVPALGGEAAGMVLQEARARCLPVICSDAGGLPEYVREGETGWLYPRHDTAALGRLLRARLDRHDELQDAADAMFRRPARRFADVAEEYRGLYAEVGHVAKKRIHRRAATASDPVLHAAMRFSPARHVQARMAEIVAELQRRGATEVWLFGTGIVADLVDPCLGAAKIGVLGYFDNDPVRQGGQRLGRPICPPRAADGHAIIVAASSHAQIAPQLQDLGFAPDDILLAYP